MKEWKESTEGGNGEGVVLDGWWYGQMKQPHMRLVWGDRGDEAGARARKVSARELVQRRRHRQWLRTDMVRCGTAGTPLLALDRLGRRRPGRAQDACGTTSHESSSRAASIRLGASLGVYVLKSSCPKASPQPRRG